MCRTDNGRWVHALHARIKIVCVLDEWRMFLFGTREKDGFDAGFFCSALPFSHRTSSTVFVPRKHWCIIFTRGSFYSSSTHSVVVVVFFRHNPWREKFAGSQQKRGKQKNLFALRVTQMTIRKNWTEGDVDHIGSTTIWSIFFTCLFILTLFLIPELLCFMCTPNGMECVLSIFAVSNIVFKWNSEKKLVYYTKIWKEWHSRFFILWHSFW